MRRKKAKVIAAIISAGLAIAGMTTAIVASEAAGSAGCLVARDVPFYQVRPDGAAPTDSDRHIPGRAAMQDPCALRLLR